LLQRSALSLVAGRVRVRRIIRKGKVEPVQRSVAGASVTSENEPGLFVLRSGVKELELSVRYPTILGIQRRRLCSVALADNLNEALAGVDLDAENLAEVPRAPCRRFPERRAYSLAV